jgi:hypothetical protein
MTVQNKAASWRSFIADTLALIVFFTFTGILNERFIAGMEWDQVLQARLLGAVLMVPVARPYGLWRDWIMRRADETRLSQILWDSTALVSFQVPIYAAIIAFLRRLPQLDEEPVRALARRGAVDVAEQLKTHRRLFFARASPG